MLSFIVQRSFVTINSQCRAFIAAVKKLKVSRWITTLLEKIHFIFCARPVHSHIHTNVFHSGPVFRHLTIANLWMVWNVWSTFMALFAGSALSGLWWRVWGLGGGNAGNLTWKFTPKATHSLQRRVFASQTRQKKSSQSEAEFLFWLQRLILNLFTSLTFFI